MVLWHEVSPFGGTSRGTWTPCLSFYVQMPIVQTIMIHDPSLSSFLSFFRMFTSFWSLCEAIRKAKVERRKGKLEDSLFGLGDDVVLVIGSKPKSRNQKISEIRWWDGAGLDKSEKYNHARASSKTWLKLHTVPKFKGAHSSITPRPNCLDKTNSRNLVL